MVRFKNRYLVCEIICPDLKKPGVKLTSHEIKSAVVGGVRNSYGTFGSACTVSVKYWNAKTGMVLIRCARDSLQIVQTSITFLQNIGQLKAIFNTLHIGGTIRSCYKFMIKHNQQQLRTMLQQCKTNDERNKVKEAIIASKVSLKETLGVSMEVDT